MTPKKTPWIDRALGLFSPRLQLQRMRDRAALAVLVRHYEGAGVGRRTQGWRQTSGDVNADQGPARTSIRERARDLVRNNPWAESALSIIGDHTVGYGIQATPEPTNDRALKVWKEWFETTACDADGRHDGYGIQKLVVRTVAESGECLVRKRIRRLDADGKPENGGPLPLQLQVLDPDFLDHTKDEKLKTGGAIIQGVEYDPIGRRVAYWLFPEHPGASYATALQSVRVPAESVLHIFRPLRPGQVRGMSWFAPVLLRFKDFDEFEDATLMKQKISACLAVFTTGGDGNPLGSDGGTTDGTGIDLLEPGLVKQLALGETVTVVSPPTVREYPDYIKTILRAIATGLGVTYEDLTGDYAEMNFSSSRSSNMKHWQRVDDWRWRMLIPQLCDPVWAWAMESAMLMGAVRGASPVAAWTPPPRPMVNPSDEGLAYIRNIRGGFQTLPEVIRELGYDPDKLLTESAEFYKKMDALGLISDCDPRKTTQGGQLQGVALPAPVAAAPAADEADEERPRLQAVPRR